jgi:mono/diheme cytochrome c family protein
MQLPNASAELATNGVVGIAGGKLEVLARAGWLAGLTGTLLLVGTLVFAMHPRAVSLTAALSLLLIAQLGIAGAEFFREMARKPYVLYGTLYSNSLWKQDSNMPFVMASPFLSRALWHPPLGEATRESGAWIFRLQCASCHTRDGYRSIAERTKAWTPAFGFKWLATMDSTKVMPPFQGNAVDRAALTSYLLSLHEINVSPETVLSNAALDNTAGAAIAPAQVTP